MHTDGQTTVGTLRQAVASFVDARDWQPFHTPKNLAISIAVEAAELMELFQWLTPEQAQEAASSAGGQAAVAGELADVIIYCLSLCNALHVDLSAAVMAKLEVDERRYPADQFRGRFRRPQRDKVSVLPPAAPPLSPS